jgi:hypothetical protein
MTRQPSGNLPLLVMLGAAALAVILTHELIAGPMQIDDAVSKSVPDFTCRDLVVETSGGSWNRNSHIMHAALRMPQPCLADLRQRVESSPQYHGEQCNLVERCWVREDGETTYTFSFYPGYASFHYEKQQPGEERRSRASL